MKNIEQTITMLLTQLGEELLDDCLRLEAFLRDYHPDKPILISVSMEVIRSSVLLELQTGTTVKEAQLLLQKRSGIAIKHAEQGIRLWNNILAQGLIPQQNNRNKEKQRKNREATVEEMLCAFRDYKKRGKQ